MEDLGTLGGPTSLAHAISETGEVVGISGTAAGTEEAFLWTRAGGMRSLGTLRVVPNSFATAVNTHRRIAGTAFSEDRALELPVLWRRESGLRRLPTLGGESGQVQGINEFGLIVGRTATAAGPAHATLWVPADGPLLVASTDEEDAYEALTR
jgi:probable HAF family extracellular repeat protein